MNFSRPILASVGDVHVSVYASCFIYYTYVHGSYHLGLERACNKTSCDRPAATLVGSYYYYYCCYIVLQQYTIRIYTGCNK